VVRLVATMKVQVAGQYFSRHSAVPHGRATIRIPTVNMRCVCKFHLLVLFGNSLRAKGI
jgi:hypothetical protein